MIIGGTVILVGLLSKAYRSIIKFGLIIFFIPIGIILAIIIFDEAINSFKYAPTMKELIGEYQITKVTVPGFDKSSLNQYKLILNSDSTFVFTPTPYIELCDTGKYQIDYTNKYNELSYHCGKGYYSGHLERRFNGFRIEFIIGDPDSGTSIYFEKNNAIP